MAKALVIYATRTHQTRKIAELIAEGIRLENAEATVVDVNEAAKIVPQLSEFDALVIGSATYHGEMLQSMKTFLFDLEKADLEGKVGGAFGAFGWSGEAPPRIYNTLKHVLRMDMVGGPLMLKSATMGGGIKMAQDYGREVARKMRAKS